jgi:hypothetical protein
VVLVLLLTVVQKKAIEQWNFVKDASGGCCVLSQEGLTMKSKLRAALVASQGTHSITAKATDLAGNTSVASGALSVTIDTAPQDVGSWSAVFPWPLIGLHYIMTPDGKILTYGTDQNGVQSGLHILDIWNPATNTHTTIENTTHTGVFCSVGLIVPETGQVLISGGDLTVSQRALNQLLLRTLRTPQGPGQRVYERNGEHSWLPDGYGNRPCRRKCISAEHGNWMSLPAQVSCAATTVPRRSAVEMSAPGRHGENENYRFPRNSIVSGPKTLSGHKRP